MQAASMAASSSCRDDTGMSVTVALPARARLRHPSAPHFNRFLLNVEFETVYGNEAAAIGGGDSILEAIAAARESLPTGLEWELVRWNHLYGD
jgi:hypothetical protein